MDTVSRPHFLQWELTAILHTQIHTTLHSAGRMTTHRLHDVHLQPPIFDDIDAIIWLTRSKQDGSGRYKDRLHVFAQLHEERLFKMAESSNTLEQVEDLRWNVAISLMDKKQRITYPH